MVTYILGSSAKYFLQNESKILAASNKLLAELFYINPDSIYLQAKKGSSAHNFFANLK
jgi:hypothetical protein